MQLLPPSILRFPPSPLFAIDPSGRAGVGRMSLRVLIVEDEAFISLQTAEMLEELGHEVVGVAVSAEQAVAMAENERPDLVLMDVRLAGARDGIDAAQEIKQRWSIPAIFVSASSDAPTRRRVEAVGAVAFLNKPLTAHRLGEALVKFSRKD